MRHHGLPTLFPDAIEKLSEWEAICRLAGIPAVPVFRGPSISVKELEAFAETHQPTPTTDKLANWIEEQRQQGNTWRWECCAPELLKLMARLRRTEERHQGLPRIPFHTDERLFTFFGVKKPRRLDSWPGLDQSAMDDVFRLSFACFSRGWDRGLQLLPATGAFRKIRARNGAGRPSDAAAGQFQSTSRIGPAIVPAEFSCDWMVRQDGEVVFSKPATSYPPRRAHPCCFTCWRSNAEGQVQKKVVSVRAGSAVLC